MKITILALAVVAAVPTIAIAGDYGEYSAPTLDYRVQRSFLTNEVVTIPPYVRPFPVRVYATPPQPPFYNVPPYAVIAPY